MKTIETSSAQEIAEYLQYLYNIARDKALENHPTYSKMYDDNAWEKLYYFLKKYLELYTKDFLILIGLIHILHIMKM